MRSGAGDRRIAALIGIPQFDEQDRHLGEDIVDEQTYAGHCMIGPDGSATLDDFLMAKSPHCVTHDFTLRVEHAPAGVRARLGLRRLVLMRLSEGADVAALEALASDPNGPADFHPDDRGRVPYKGRP